MKNILIILSILLLSSSVFAAEKKMILTTNSMLPVAVIATFIKDDGRQDYLSSIQPGSENHQLIPDRLWLKTIFQASAGSDFCAAEFNWKTQDENVTGVRLYVQRIPYPQSGIVCLVSPITY